MLHFLNNLNLEKMSIAMQSKNSMNVRMLAPRNNPSIPPTSPEMHKNSTIISNVYLNNII